MNILPKILASEEKAITKSHQPRTVSGEALTRMESKQTWEKEPTPSVGTIPILYEECSDVKQY